MKRTAGSSWRGFWASTPGADQRRAWQSEDRSYLVLTMGRGRIVTLRNFRERDEAGCFAGLGQMSMAESSAATIGYQHRRRHRPGDTGHIIGLLPSAIGAPIIAWAVIRRLSRR